MSSWQTFSDMSAGPNQDAKPIAPESESSDESHALRDAINYVSELHGSIRRPVVVIVLLGAAAGIVEAAALILFVRAAVAITTDNLGDQTIAGTTVDFSPGTLLLIAIILSILVAALHVVLARASVRLGEKVAVNSRSRLIDGFLDAQWSYVAQYREGRLQEAISVLSEHAARATTHLAVGLTSIVIIITLGIAAIVASPLISLTLIAVPLVVFLIARPQLRKLRVKSQENVENSMGLSEATASTANLALEYRTTGTQREQANLLKGIAASHARRVAEVRAAGFTMTFLFKDSALIALIAVVGGLYLITDLRAAAITAAILLIIRMLGYFQQAFRLVQEGTEDFATISALRASIAELEDHREDGGSIHLAQIDTIAFNDVRYSYDRERNALDGVTLQIEPRTTIGLIGPSGAGKSTIAEILLGLRYPDEGSVTVNGEPVSDILRDEWTRLSSLVPQDQLLAQLSVADNIRFLRNWIDDESIVDAAKRAHVHDEIMALPERYGYVLGSRNQGLSGGQRQRIAIARALAGQPQLLVLDEPTSALDATTEQLFRQTLDELHGQITIIVIAHRPATLQACDTVVKVRDGRIECVEDGPMRTVPTIDSVG
jgi:ATP-binding cassette subfamily B protein